MICFLVLVSFSIWLISLCILAWMVNPSIQMILLNKEVLVESDSLFAAKSSGIEEEANLCLALLMGYNATIYDNGDKREKKQAVLDRICNILKQLPPSLLKVRLLAFCYGEIYEESLLQEAYGIIDGWDKATLNSEQTEIIEELKNIADNPYPFEEIEE